MGERQRHRADVSIDWHHRPAMLRDQDALKDCPFERRVVGNPRAVRISSGREHDLGDGLSRNPGLDRAITTGKTDAQYLAREMFSVSTGADALLPLFQLGGTTALDVPMERGAVLGLGGAAWHVELGDALSVIRRVRGGYLEVEICGLQLDGRGWHNRRGRGRF
jgi:hypothetical protein